ncbi:hypothetical protein AAY473_009757 [Plecturocebus cupreus]
MVLRLEGLRPQAGSASPGTKSPLCLAFPPNPAPPLRGRGQTWRRGSGPRPGDGVSLLLPRLECSGSISAHHNPPPPGFKQFSYLSLLKCNPSWFQLKVGKGTTRTLSQPWWALDTNPCYFSFMGHQNHYTLPVIPAHWEDKHFGRPRVGRDHLRTRVRDQHGQHGETPSLLKIQKLARHDGGHLESQLLWRLRQENCLNPGSGGYNWEIPGRGATGVASTFCRCPSAALLGAEYTDGQARLVPSPQGKQQLEALRTESFTASTAEPRKVQLCGERTSTKGKLRNRKNIITGRREIQDGRVAAAQDCSSQ